mgnify:CR=1 FL=1
MRVSLDFYRSRNMNETSKVELLAPAGSLEIFYSVIAAGADAVYLGGDLFGARAYATNFSREEIITAIHYAHLLDRKVYLTINTLVKNEELNNQLYSYIQPFYEEGLDAVIVQDLGVAAFIHENFPLLDLHASTQLSITSSYGAQVLKDLGFTRIVPARELSFEEIVSIRKNCNIEIESFIHGAMCYCYSGQCLFSSLLGGRSGNRGRCTQPCRLPYDLLDEDKHLIESEKYILSMNDMNTLPILDQLLSSGICSFKIEGRMKQKEYAQGVVHVYRRFIDQIVTQNQNLTKKEIQKGVTQLTAYGCRSGFSTGYYEQYNGSSMITMNNASYSSDLSKIDSDLSITPAELAITGTLTALVGQPLKLLIQIDGTNHSVSLEGPIVEAAQKAPATREQLQEKLTQINDTVFRFKTIDLRLDSNAFVPASILKRLRRQAIEELEQQLLAKDKRIVSTPVVNPAIETAPTNYEQIFFVQKTEQLEVILKKSQPSQIIVSYDLWKSDQARIIEQIKLAPTVEFYLDLPWVIREQTIQQLTRPSFLSDLKYFTGVQVNSLDGLGFSKQLKGQGLKVMCGPHLYQMNDWSSYFLDSIADKVTLPYELNKKELWGLQNKNALLTIYGYLPLMISAQCVFRSLERCKHSHQAGYLKDRYDKLFYVETSCIQCNNIIYNSEPLCLLQHYQTLTEHGFHRFRLDFHMESEQQVEEVLQLMERCLKKEPIKASDIPFSYTNGHFKRGVE